MSAKRTEGVFTVIIMSQTPIPTYPDAAMNEQGVRFIDPEDQERFFPWHQVVIQRSGAFRTYLNLYSEDGKAYKIDNSDAAIVCKTKFEDVPPHPSEKLQLDYFKDSNNEYSIATDYEVWPKVFKAVRKKSLHAHLVVAILSALFVVWLLAISDNIPEGDIGDRFRNMVIVLYVLLTLLLLFQWRTETVRLRSMIKKSRVKRLTQSGLGVIDAAEVESFIQWDKVELDSQRCLRTFDGKQILWPRRNIEQQLIGWRFTNRPQIIPVWKWIVYLLSAAIAGRMFWILIQYLYLEGEFANLGVEAFVIFPIVCWLLAFGLYHFNHWNMKNFESKSQ